MDKTEVICRVERDIPRRARVFTLCTNHKHRPSEPCTEEEYLLPDILLRQPEFEKWARQWIDSLDGIGR